VVYIGNSLRKRFDWLNGKHPGSNKNPAENQNQDQRDK
jgi:hypothetical protein